MTYFLTALTVFLFLEKTTPARAIEVISVSAKQSSSLKTITLEVPGMTCVTCPYTVRKSLEVLEGVKAVKTSFDSKTTVVTFDPTKTTVQKLIKTTTNVGYASTLKKEN